MHVPSIRVCEKYGVNPSVGVCFWCGEDDGTVILPGRLKGDAEAPRRAVWSYDPCEKCKGLMAQGFALLEAKHDPERDGQPPMKSEGRDVYPTGRWMVLKREAAVRLFGEELTKGARAFTKPAVLDRIEAEAREATGEVT